MECPAEYLAPLAAERDLYNARAREYFIHTHDGISEMGYSCSCYSPKDKRANYIHSNTRHTVATHSLITLVNIN